MWSANFLPIGHVSVSPPDGIGPTQGQRKLWPGWELNPPPSGLITATPLTELQGQTGTGRGKWRCQLPGNEYIQVQGWVTFITNVGRVALHITLYDSICPKLIFIYQRTIHQLKIPHYNINKQLLRTIFNIKNFNNEKLFSLNAVPWSACLRTHLNFLRDSVCLTFQRRLYQRKAPL